MEKQMIQMYAPGMMKERKLAEVLKGIREQRLMSQARVEFNQEERIIKQFANSPIVGWAFTDESGKVYDDMQFAVERGDGGIATKTYLLKDGLIGFFSHCGMDFEAFYETEFKRLQERNGVDVEIETPHRAGTALTNQAGFDLLYGLQHSDRYVRSVWLTMGDANYEAAKGVVRELCVYFMRALPSDMQYEMDGALPNGWWLEEDTLVN